MLVVSKLAVGGISLNYRSIPRSLGRSHRSSPKRDILDFWIAVVELICEPGASVWRPTGSGRRWSEQSIPRVSLLPKSLPNIAPIVSSREAMGTCMLGIVDMGFYTGAILCALPKSLCIYTYVYTNMYMYVWEYIYIYIIFIYIYMWT